MNLDPMRLTALDAALIGILALAAIGAWIALTRWYQQWTRRRRWSRAQAAERAAPRLLRRMGYEVLGAQVEGGYSLSVDGRPLAVALRADYIVAREGALYVAEVKSGKFAPQLGNAATRRQLLEYLMAFDVQGVLLVDSETEQVHQVVFPVSRRATSTSTVGGVVVATAIALVVTVVVLVALQYFRG